MMSGKRSKQIVDYTGLADTYPKILLQNHKKYGGLASMRKKNYGIWNEYTWNDCYEGVKNFALGLKTLGLERGDKVCIIGDNDPEWYWAAIAAQAIGGVVVGMYIDATPNEIQYIAGHSDSVFAIAKDQEQSDKFLESRDKLPRMKKVIYWDPKGMWGYKNESYLSFFNDVLEMGKEYDKKHPGFFEEEIGRGKSTDIGVLCYTSGTTGALPKGAQIGYDMLVNACMQSAKVNPIFEGDEYLSFVPQAWIAEQLMGIGSWLVSHVKINFPEEPETVMENIREIGPQYLLFGPRQWEGMFSMVLVRINDTGWLKRWIYNTSLKAGHMVAHYHFDLHREPPWYWQIAYQVANAVCFIGIRDYIGLATARMGITGGSALGPDIFRWYRAIGINIKESYGLTECQLVAGHGDQVKIGTVGPPCPGTTVRISDEGEIQVTNDWIFKGYYKMPEETAKTVIDGKWVRTGDAGFFDDDGHLVILDRVKDMLKLRTGDKYSPTYIENRLKFSPYVKDAMAVAGEERDFIFCIINIDFDNVSKWAEKNRLSFTTYTDLSQKNEIYDLIQKDVDRVNKLSPKNSRIVRYCLLHKEFDADEGELTRTRKLRRNFMAERYHQLIDAAYGGQESITVEAEVKYRDGRKGKVTTSINIRDTKK
jgi:long-chain acyl-CoA synthetase